ncbi:MAG: NADH-quinone oxidoreductase subunit N [Verrucomicrobiota bacterium]
MNFSTTSLEIAVILLGLGVLLADLWLPAERKTWLGMAAAAGLGVIFLGSFLLEAPAPRYAFDHLYVLDHLALYFKRFFLLAGVFVLLMSVEFADRIRSGIAEWYALLLFALAGMMFASSANDLLMVFASLELITVTFYVLTSFQRTRLTSLEAGVKYLIVGALSTAFTVYGIALVFGVANTTSFDKIFAANAAYAANPAFLAGLLLVLVGLGFKIAAFPFQIWAPDVYQGAPTPATAFLAIGSKAAGIVLLLRLLFGAVPQITLDWTKLLLAISAATILYGNLCAIPQRNLKRLLGYSSIAHAGYLLMGVAAMNRDGSSAILYYLGGYLFTVLAAFTVIAIVAREVEGEDIAAVAGLQRRSPLLAAGLSLAMVSLAGIPPLAGFFGKFLLFRALLERGAVESSFYWLIGIAIVGVVISFYYYLGVVRTIYWAEPEASAACLQPSRMTRWALGCCMAGMLFLGLYPAPLVRVTNEAVGTLTFRPDRFVPPVAPPTQALLAPARASLAPPQ